MKAPVPPLFLRFPWVRGMALVAWAGKCLAGGLGLDPVAFPAGGGASSVDALQMEAVVGQVVADSSGAEAAPGTRLQVGYLIQATPWNRPPVAGGNSIHRPMGTRAAKIRLADLMLNDTDADGDPLTLLGVGAAQPAGATVALGGGFVVYVAPAGDSGHGSFEYEISDGAGGHRVRGLVSVMETSGGRVVEQPNAVSVAAEGWDRVFVGIGVPGRRYRVQYATGLGAPYPWHDFDPVAEVETATHGALGVFRYVDRAPADGLRLYRAVVTPW